MIREIPPESERQQLVRLSVLARQWGTTTHSLVEASRREKFVPLVQIGDRWFAKPADVEAWLARNHAAPRLSELDLDRVRAAGAAAAQSPSPRRRARSASS